MLAVTGKSTSIVREIAGLLGDRDQVQGLDLQLATPNCGLYQIPMADRYLFAAGVLHQRPIREQSAAEIIESFSVNCINVIRLCEMILEEQPTARICIVGSESAWRGSFDLTYAAGKAAVHAYVKARRTTPQQQIVCVSPPIISDAGMTLRRKDYPQVLEQRDTVTSLRVAQVIHKVLYELPPDHLNRCVVPIHPNRSIS